MENIIRKIILEFLILAVCLPGKGIHEKAPLSEDKKAIRDFLTEQSYEADFHNPALVKFELAYIDEDEIPELLLCQGNSHIDGIVIYGYDSQKDEMVKVDSFSSFGRLYYAPYENMVESSYGNHGYYTHIFTKIQEDFTVIVADALLSDGGMNESGGVLYYHGTDSDTYHGVFYEMTKKPISEMEYDEIEDELMGGARQEVNYTDMMELTEENLAACFS